MKSAEDTATERAEAEKRPPHSESITALGRDWVVRGIVVALVLASIPLLLPIMSEPRTATYAHRILDLPFILAVLVAIRFRLRKEQEPKELRFWSLLALGFVGWALAMASNPLVAALTTPGTASYYLAMSAPYLLDYGFLFAAFVAHPHERRDPKVYPLRVLDWAGSFILFLAVLTYFLVAPSVAGGNSAIREISLAFFSALNAYLILRIWYLRKVSRTRKWKSIYSWLLVGVTTWAIGDFLVLIGFEPFIPTSPHGTPYSLLWPIALSAVVIATRSGLEGQDNDSDPEPTPRIVVGMGPLVAYALAPLVLHTMLYRFGNPELGLAALRETLAISTTMILGGMALGYQWLLHVENRRLTKEEASARERLTYQAFYDDLTGLPNRSLFRDRLQQNIEDSIRYGRRCGVMYCDLDQFKVINDSLGHAAGDLALIAIAERLRGSVRKQDTVARFGGDEFALICPGLHEALDAAQLAEKFLAVVREPLVVGDKVHALSASLGVAVFPDDGEDAEVLLKHADTAMYQAKLHGRNSYRLFTEAMNEAAEERLAVEQGLRSGLVENRFAVFFQPIVALSSGQPVAYEALLRWKHPERGHISPVNFIDVAEQTGLILPIGKWVLETACSWAAQLDPSAYGAPSLSVNISPRQLRNTRLAEDVAEVLQSTGLNPKRLQLEITESMALTDDFTASALNELREVGVSIAIDDFGTGYAALSRLQELPVDIVKIDASFVQGVENGSVNEAIVHAIVEMARALNFYVIAEGVETELELDVVRQSHCDAAQGYHLCPPLPPDELEEKIADLISGSGKNTDFKG